MSTPGQPPYGQPPQPYARQPYPSPAQAPQQQGGYPAPQPYPATGWAPPAPAAPRPGLVRHPLPVVTMDKLVGHEITEVLGEVVGVVVRPRELRPDLRTGDVLGDYAAMLTASRQDAVRRLVEMAGAAGADAVVGLRYDSSEITQSLSEVVAYGTAVRLAGGPQPVAPVVASAEPWAPPAG